MKRDFSYLLLSLFQFKAAWTLFVDFTESSRPHGVKYLGNRHWIEQFFGLLLSWYLLLPVL
jgi:hypothetical protein